VSAICISDTATSNLTRVSSLLKMPDNDGDGPTASTSQSTTCEGKRTAFDVLIPSQAVDFDDFYEVNLLMDEKALVTALQGASARSDANSDAKAFQMRWVRMSTMLFRSIEVSDLVVVRFGSAGRAVHRSTSMCFWGLCRRLKLFYQDEERYS
jgi:hypothetical protein